MKHTLAKTYEFEADGKGSLAGNAAVCSCGYEVKTSLSRDEAVRQLVFHVDYSQRNVK